MAKKLLEVAADIVQTQASVSHMTSDEVTDSLKKVFVTLQEMQKSEAEGITLEKDMPAGETIAGEPVSAELDPKQSIRENEVICLECGADMKQLTAKHLGTHDLTIKEYKKKYGILAGQSLSAKSLSRARSRAAKKRGLPASLVRYQEQKRQAKKEAEETGAASVSEPSRKTIGGRSRKRANA